MQQMQQMQMQMAMSTVQSMTTSGNYLFAASGDTIYKINEDGMIIVGQVKLPRPQPQQPRQGQGQGQGKGGGALDSSRGANSKVGGANGGG